MSHWAEGWLRAIRCCGGGRAQFGGKSVSVNRPSGSRPPPPHTTHTRTHAQSRNIRAFRGSVGALLEEGRSPPSFRRAGRPPLGGGPGEAPERRGPAPFGQEARAERAPPPHTHTQTHTSTHQKSACLRIAPASVPSRFLRLRQSPRRRRRGAGRGGAQGPGRESDPEGAPIASSGRLRGGEEGGPSGAERRAGPQGRSSVRKAGPQGR